MPLATAIRIEPGTVFGRLTVIERGPNRGGQWAFYCRCECGKVAHVRSYQLRIGHSTSCGCYGNSACRTHGHTSGGKKGPAKSGAYSSWIAARQRCENPRISGFHRYSGRGIRMCEEWRSDFSAFYRDMGPRPEGCTLDRIDNEGNYEPGNCRWATPKEQGQNRSTTRARPSPAHRPADQSL